MKKIFDPSDKDPFLLFREWMAEAENAEPNNPNAMCLSTVGKDGRPSSRMVLLKLLDKDGFVFFSNSQSRKGAELDNNPYVALCLYWKSLQRQVRIEGKVEIVTREQTQAYFNSRLRGSQIASYASDQSRPLADKAIYEARIKEAEKRFEGVDIIPCPDHWNGHRVIPSSIEFWVEGQYRTHDRFVFTPDANGDWTAQRLYP